MISQKANFISCNTTKNWSGEFVIFNIHKGTATTSGRIIILSSFDVNGSLTHFLYFV